MTNSSDTPRVFWSREDWLAELDELVVIQAEAEANNDTDTARF